MTDTRLAFASSLYALSQGAKNDGDLECHWCAAPCKRFWLHDDPPPIPFSRSRSTALRPANPYVCVGCWIFHRKRVTVQFLRGDGAFKDGQCPLNHSWWIEPNGAWSIVPLDYTALYERLLQPPHQFILSLIDREAVVPNLLQLMEVNDNAKIDGSTPLHFTLNNTRYQYTVYELETCLQDGKVQGKEPGVTALLKFLGPYLPLQNHNDIKKNVGRPKKNGTEEMGNKTRQVVRDSITSGKVN